LLHTIAVKNPNYSVVIPVLNGEKTIARAIQSALRQTVPPYEVIVVDDKSEDNTAQIVTALSSPNVKLMENAGSRGPGSARGAGARASHGQWVAYLDADDWWEPQKMQAQLAVLNAQNEPVVCASSYLLHSGQRTMARRFRGPRANEDIGTYLFCDLGDYHTSTMVLSKQCIKYASLCEEWPRHEDWGLMLALETRGTKFLFIDELLSHRECGRARAAQSTLSRAFIDIAGPHLVPRAKLGFLINIVLYKLMREKDISGIKQCLREAAGLTLLLGADAVAVWTRIVAANARHRLPRAFWGC
jgi:glycosyltransferase involved in cell wall biosynthesis